jgi:hypothetical protein
LIADAPADDGDSVVVKAIKPIKKGEEITFSYQPKVVHRPDMSLYIYGESLSPGEASQPGRRFGKRGWGQPEAAAAQARAAIGGRGASLRTLAAARCGTTPHSQLASAACEQGAQSAAPHAKPTALPGRLCHSAGAAAAGRRGSAGFQP